jgi:hypothetical protein
MSPTGPRKHTRLRGKTQLNSSRYRWKAKYGGIELIDMQRVKQLEDENHRLKHVVAEETLDVHG